MGKRVQAGSSAVLGAALRAQGAQPSGRATGVGWPHSLQQESEGSSVSAWAQPGFLVSEETEITLKLLGIQAL